MLCGVAVSVEDLETFYESWRSVTDDNQCTDLHAELLQMEIMGFKHTEVCHHSLCSLCNCVINRKYLLQ